MTKPAPQSPQLPPRLVLAADEGTGQITVDVRSFIVFNGWMDEQLERLQTRFAGFETPGWTTRRRNNRRH